MPSVRGAYKQHPCGWVDPGHMLEGGEGTFARSWHRGWQDGEKRDRQGQGSWDNIGKGKQSDSRDQQGGTPWARDMAFMDMAGKFFTAGTNSIGAIEELYLW